jgi:flagellar protein FlgJ
MATSPVNAGFYADFGQMEQLRNTAARDPQAAVKAAARQFESLFTQMMLKSMRQANLGEGMGDSDETKFYQDMFDQQLSVQLSSGKGIGLAEKLISQLQRGGAAAPGPVGIAAPVAKPPMPMHVIHAPTLPMATTSVVPVAVDATTQAPASAPAVAPASASADATAAAMSPRARTPHEAFIDSIQPAAERVAQQLGVSTETILAHAALETGWGRHLPAMAGNNLFGMKAGGSWQGARVQATTTEFSANGARRLQADFRSYPSVSAGLDDYASLVGNSPRYAQALNQGDDVAAYGRGLQHGGYATDPAYVRKLVDTAAAVRQVIAAQPLKNAPLQPTTAAGDTG